MNMVRSSIYFQRSTMEAIYHATKISMQLWTQVSSDEGNPILGSVNDVIEEIRIRHSKIVTHESSETLSGWIYYWGQKN